MPDLPHIYDSTRTLTINLPSDVSAKLATYRREMHPDLTDEEVVAYLVGDSLIRLGLLELPGKDRGKAAGQTRERPAQLSPDGPAGSSKAAVGEA